MAFPFTKTGYNMFDMLSMLQKSIRREDFTNAGFAAEQLKNSYRKIMWSRLLVITAEDCFGIITKEVMALKEKDDKAEDDKNISRAIAIMCNAKKNRDACYFSCDFVLASRKPREINVSTEELTMLHRRIDKSEEPHDEETTQLSLFDNDGKSKAENFLSGENYERLAIGVRLQKAIDHRDMDMIGYEMDLLRKFRRDFLWETFIDKADGDIKPEIIALRKADDTVNANKKNKDEIFISKAAILICHSKDSRFDTVRSSDIIDYHKLIEWDEIWVKPINECKGSRNSIPDWVYDCHTLKGKKMGKTDWDMTVTEQAALHPLQKAYFDEASWAYTYEDDYRNGIISYEGMKPIWEFGKTHPVNPIEVIPYDD